MTLNLAKYALFLLLFAIQFGLFLIYHRILQGYNCMSYKSIIALNIVLHISRTRKDGVQYNIIITE